MGLEKGTLIEILRKEIGPWWFGRIKKEDASLVEEILDPELGWFPKEFVRVIHSPETDAFFLRHLADEEQRHKDQHINHMQINELSSSTIVQQTTTNTSSSIVAAASGGVDNQMLLNTSSSAPCTPINTSSEDNCNTTIIDKHNVTTIVIETSSPPSTALLLEQQSSERTMDQDEQQQQQRDATSTTTTTLTANGQTVLSTSQSLNVIMGSTEILRRSAVKELLDTEVNYVKLLQAICEG